MQVLLIALVCVLASWLLTSLVRRYALKYAVLDLPNSRSSHQVPTPRGGGVGIIGPIIVALLAAPMAGVSRVFCAAGAVAIGLVAALGWIDDHRSLSVRTRLAGHLGAGLVVAAIAAGEAVQPFGDVVPAAVSAIWWIFWTISAINVVNFIDGTDGIIGLQALVFGLFSLAAAGLPVSPAAVLGAALAGAALGFLLLNWAPARIFMGDVGSGSLGVVFVVLGVVTIRQEGWTVVHAFLPLMPIFADEVLTMGRRVARGEALSEPHRTHVYQRLVQAGWGHGRVAMLYGVLASACGAWALIHRSGTPIFWAGTTAALVSTLIGLYLLRAWAERRCEPLSPAVAG